ncbi:uncharacterized protein LOC129969540 isoform X1 [Argiope bruennichi]|uniref:uncharacterized protein LOC129969540 isoform X1 n=1 Tax=Argiope bruennichi TaxID=94029 RepID=UPI002493DF3F|nr:uncharacterized protein LOC129969540 isoform X1 [Argiope bruennichi]XP_055940127.1 uncharacterized protein LOC129969540 isoform X1 [Argiope bruennichi]XP_055940128.1 uncharacterized protein LOC129969540 isoform X1 [Argiope bruennichi]XP_055940129.1 uncharacterized protein LOC129969540 isoform X1 [Argiope bruennichi]XP_055940130.1 uncharacterized protein LOC129969540 isoform X1 [Argiope bruennichi]
MSLSSKITDDEMRYFQFKARQLYLLRKEDHEWNEFCKRNTCTCCTCQTNSVPKVKEVGVQSFPKRILPSSAKSTAAISHSNNKNLPQTLNEIKTKLEKIDLTLSEMKVPANGMKEMTRPKEIFDKQLTFPIESDMAESVKSVINERKMHLIQNSLKMSLQRLHSAAVKITRPDSNVKIKKKSTGYFIPRELERQRVAARRAYLASLGKTVVEPKVLPHSIKEKAGARKDNLKPKVLKTTAKSNLQKFNKSNNQKEEECTLVESNDSAETKDENIETAIDAIMDDVLGETVLVINKIKQSKSGKSTSLIQNTEQVANNSSLRNLSVNLDSKEADAAMVEQFQNKLEKIKHLHCAKNGSEPRDKQGPVEIKKITEAAKNATESELIISSSTNCSIQPKSIPEIKHKQILRELTFNPLKGKQISKCRKDFWSYLDRISRTKKGNFDPWALSNLVAESLLDDCIQEIAEELQDVPASLIADLYDQEFLQSI